jgi:caffeoyl-CoA O-methyltransferase
LWYGKVTAPDEIKPSDKMSQGIVEFNRIVVEDPRTENVILPLRDGINLIRVK